MRRRPALIAVGLSYALVLSGGAFRNAFPARAQGAASASDCARPPGARARTRPPDSVILSDAQAACLVHRSPWKPRPGNRVFNQTIPSTSQLEAFWRSNTNPYRYHVTGHFRGTTDEIIQWAAWKWGIDANVLRAVAAVESWWRQRLVGNAGTAFGLTQVRSTSEPGTWPLSQESTAFNVDYYGAIFRYYYDGRARWLGNGYRAGDLWGSIGAHYAGSWWSASARWYVAKVKRYLRERIWRWTWFSG